MVLITINELVYLTKVDSNNINVRHGREIITNYFVRYVRQYPQNLEYLLPSFYIKYCFKNVHLHSLKI